MTTAREQAREAVRKSYRSSDLQLGWNVTKEAADAASDIWEPLLQEWMAMYDSLTPHTPLHYQYRRLAARTREALGG